MAENELDGRYRDFQQRMAEILRMQPYLARQVNPYTGAPLPRPEVNISEFPAAAMSSQVGS